MSDCEHELPRRAAGLPPDWRARLDAARATVARLTPAATLTERRALAEAWLEVIELEAGAAFLELRAAPEAEVALRALGTLVAADDDPALRTALAFALLAIGPARRIPAPRGRAKVDAEVQAIEAALVLAERAPAIDTLVATCLSAIVKSGQFQLEPDLRERAFAAGRELRERFSTTASPRVAAEVARGLDEWAKMLPKTSPEREELLTERDRLRALATP